MSRRILSSFLCSLVFLVCAALPLTAQQTTATLSGLVSDPTGDVLAKAEITLTNTATNAVFAGTTNDSGEYRINLLPVGTYTLKIAAPGFKTYVQNGIVLDLGQSATINAQLAVGTSVETVDVTSAVPLVNTTTSEVGATVQNVEIENLPMVNRNVYDLLSLVPGVQTNTQGFTLGYPQQVVLINGGVQIANSGSTSYYLDGGTNMTGLRNTGNVQPNPDAVDQFRVETNNYSAEYGRFPNGVINVITKVRKQPMARIGLRVLAREWAQCQRLQLDSLNSAASSPIWRYHRRSHHQRQDLLLLQLRRPASDHHDLPELSDRSHCGTAWRRLLG